MPSRLFLVTVLISLTAMTGCGETDAQATKTGDDQPASPSHAQNSKNAQTAEGGEHGNDAEGGGHSSAGGHADEKADRVHLTETQRNQLDIQVAPAKAGSAAAIVSAPATVRFDSDRVARIGPRLSAKVLEVKADLGDQVKAGDTVAMLDSVALGRAKASYLTAVARYANALAAYRRNKKLAEDQIISEAQMLESRAEYQQARAERNAARAELKLYGLSKSAIDDISTGGETPLSRYELTTPIDGVIQQRGVMPGQTITANETPIQVVDNSHMWVMIDVAEQHVARVKPGQPVELCVRSLPDKVFQGRSDWVSRELDKQSRTVRVRAVVPNENDLLRAGMFGTAQIATDSEQRFALVPVDAVQTIKDQEVVFVPGHEAGAFRAVPVETGSESAGRIEIRRGVDAGDRVVFQGAFDLMSALTASGRSASHGH